ncbi:MAG TPA: exodeoxyribonuclease VII large subunit, partial [Pirellulaceae bacterium]|nr:exodeoxyribonuclease VII large subunit [Pirellulaceae bacterium]
QLIVRQIEPKGEGALQVALRQLHAKLAAEGLFDERHKQPLPRFPRRVAVVTSPTSAAVRDFLEVVRRRWPALEVLVIPARVQGDGASAEVARGIQYANRMSPRPDILVVTRGGGSLEDLWAFNEEPVVRAIFASEIPVVSAIGHEIDVTLADLVADVRALTPTEAGERVAPSRDELRSAVRQLGTRLVGGLRRRAAEARLRLDNLSQRRCLRRPFDRIQELKRRVDELDMRAVAAARRAIRRSHDRILSMAAQLESLSPLAVLTRGYSVTVRADDRRLLVDAADVRPGELIETRLKTGAIVSRVEKTDK